MPAHITRSMLRQQLQNRLAGKKRFPFVLMLEPLYTCNLACLGCSTERHTGKLKDRMPVEKALEAVDLSEAPIVSLCGGEPTIYPELPELVDGIIARKRHIYLCTNGLMLDKNLFGRIPPNKRLTINIHLDGLKKTHDYVCNREGVFDKAIDMIRQAKDLGYHVTTNTTVFKETSVDEVEELCQLVTDLGVDGILLSPGYHYESVQRDIFLSREETHKKFQRILEFAGDYPLTSTPLFLEFAAGLRDYRCSPWSTVTFTPLGWKGPCYLIGQRYHATWEEFWNQTDWDYWESRKDDLCQNCMMHSGFEASTVMELPKSPKDMLRMARWHMS
ncbi:MAG TPA: adenosyl-hopene transferase HpnH [Myxococcales bacterium LLY-WYZ-16_1]|jgi:hopanoid biosynthesis associated radical SAM protein HpnH|nr:adenosyl-hopene transferase HpnH [Myxococcales bacterium LLY-WYZ-16_1]